MFLYNTTQKQSWVFAGDWIIEILIMPTFSSIVSMFLMVWIYQTYMLWAEY